MSATSATLAATLGCLGSISSSLQHRLGATRLSILIFHRVLAERDPLFPGEMHAERFDALVRHLARHFRVFTVRDALRLLRQGGLPARAVAITFDDGYADNAEHALPILQRHGVLASFYVSTGFLDGGRMWNDSIIECLRATRREVLDLSAFGIGRVTIGDLGQRRAVIERLLPKVKYLGLREREAALSELMSAASHPELPRDLMMTTTQLRCLHGAGMELGGHTVNHPILRMLSIEQARQEVVGGREVLESKIDAPVHTFAFPNGKPGDDYLAEHVDIVREAGFEAALSTVSGVASAASDRHQLPRYSPWSPSLARWSIDIMRSRLGSRVA